MSFEDRDEKRARMKQREELRRQQELADLKAILKLPAGRRFIWRLLEDAAPLRDAFTGNSNTYYILGKQAFGRLLMSDILEHYPKEYMRMQSEATARKRAEKFEEGIDNG